jgi:hypothetical protein
VEVKPTQNKKYKITSGIALSNIGDEKEYGAEIVLSSYQEKDFDIAPGDYYVTISYDEAQVDVFNEKGDKPIHWTETPKINIEKAVSGSPDSPENKIILAKINVPQGVWESDSKFVNTDDRRQIGPALRSIKGNVGIGTSAPSEKLEVNGNVKASKFIGDGSALTGVKVGQWADVAGGISYNAGNVGIGTSASHIQAKYRSAGRRWAPHRQPELRFWRVHQSFNSNQRKKQRLFLITIN